MQYKDFAFSHKPGGSQSQRQGQSPIKKRARFIMPSIVNSSAQLAETSYRQQGARTHTHKDNKIQLSHMQKRRSPRLKAAMTREEDNQIERNGVKDNKIQLTHIQKRQSPRLKVAMGEVESNKSKTRGPTLCAKVHGRIFEEREQIIFNANWQPIGPSDQALSNFSSFLGTIARTHVYCPLTYNSWKELLKTRREEIWDYVNSKYILHAQAERYVMKTINEAWRIHKCRVKSSHFTKYRTDAECLKNRPLSIPEIQFKKLIKYWKTEKVKKLSEMNTTNRALQKWPHRVGPTSFARIRERLRASKENHDSPSQAEIFVTTRRGNQRKQLDAETSNKIDKIQLQPSNLYLELRNMAKFVVMEEMSLYLL
ncbi:putative transposase, Ptta/En/Spm, plant [Senna tora]|uniref:Putative transposase, Ptta/En/Spm, plant n=1 Tax=Senna tora TaxID=362788 RepID=A0A834SY89_9FABA|nr:putative transposase, Ptta/En/Spm, plant [Senna tora]